jgi:hypothetical protein
LDDYQDNLGSLHTPSDLIIRATASCRSCGGTCVAQP